MSAPMWRVSRSDVSSCSTRVGTGLAAQGLLDSLVGAHAMACGERITKRMTRPVCKQFSRVGVGSLRQRIRSQGRTLAKMEIRSSTSVASTDDDANTSPVAP